MAWGRAKQRRVKLEKERSDWSLRRLGGANRWGRRRTARPEGVIDIGVRQQPDESGHRLVRLRPDAGQRGGSEPADLRVRVGQARHENGHGLHRRRPDLLEGVGSHLSHLRFAPTERFDQHRQHRFDGRTGRPQGFAGVVPHVPVRVGQGV
ncbi:MAG: hypothetical protein ABGY75_12165 [Gemmataceae bacterium]